eukprot:Seg1799.2 transcript_id=Seg1799.2/GoldUCD/mRNA.D3Y31 product="Sphingosine 1-phosphate receptor 1" protein_id=Seg1799.2/GoldUCD/D3Y31
MSDTKFIIVVVLNGITDAFIIFINSFLMHAIRRLKKHNKISYQLMAILSLSDTFVAITGILFHLTLTLQRYHILSGNNFGVDFTDRSYVFFAYFSAYMILLISLDRFVRMKYLNRYDNIVTKRRIILQVSIGMAVILVMCFARLTTPTSNESSITYVISGLSLLVIISIYVLYFRTYFAVRKRVMNLHLSTGMNDTSNNRRNAETEFAKGMAFVLLSLALAYIPYIAFAVYCGMKSITMDKRGKDDLDIPVVYAGHWVSLIALTNSAFNAIILIICNTELKTFARQNLSCTIDAVLALQLPSSQGETDFKRSHDRRLKSVPHQQNNNDLLATL